MKCHPPRQKVPQWRLFPTCVVCLAFLVCFAALAQSVPRQYLPPNLPRAAQSAQPAGKLPESERLTLAIGLPLRNEDQLRVLLKQLYDPQSTNFHRFLTPQQFTDKFGPAERDYEVVKAFARAGGLDVPREHPNRLLVEVNGSVANIERLFHTTLRTYQHPTEKRTFYAPDTPPSLDLPVRVLAVSGLDNFSVPQPRLQDSPLAIKPKASPNDGAGPSGSYYGADFRAAYAPDTAMDGTGQVLGLLQFDGYDTNDILYYESNAGLPSVTLSNVLLNGATGTGSGGGGQTECSLDIEMAISMAPGLSRIIVYEAPNPSPFEVILNQMANDNIASQLSCSWFMPGSPSRPTADTIFMQMAAQGQSFFNASGDSDAYSGLIDFPGDNPYITQVGGTSLSTTGPGGALTNEVVWNRNNGIGSGGGISTQYSIPAWQTNIDMSLSGGSTTMRNVPDVAMVAENIYVRAAGTDHRVGGTSASAPLWAGFAALANQQAATLGQGRIGFFNPLLATMAVGTNFAGLLNDITTGNNTNSGSPNAFFAVPGYDLCTGWGTPTGQNLINQLAPLISVSLPPSATESDGVLINAGTVQLWSAPPTNVVVTLASSDTNKVTVPPSVTVLAGTNTAAFNLTIIDNSDLDGTATPTITASAPGYGAGRASMFVYDNEAATLQVSLPATVSEGDGTVQGTVTASAAPINDIPVGLSSSDTAAMQVPSSVVLPAGQTSVMFTATVVDNEEINDPQDVTITAHVRNWTDGQAMVTVLDDENLNLTVTLPSSINENAGTLPNAGMVSISGMLTTNLTVTLVSGNTNKLLVPATMTIPAGAFSNTFNLMPVDNAIADGNQSISVTASAPEFTNGVASVLIIDDESPAVPSDPRPADTATGVPANTNLMWSNGQGGEFIQNGGFETGTFTNWHKENNDNFGDFVINDGSYHPPGLGQPTPPYDGSFCVVSAQNGSGTHVLYQDITLPPAVSLAQLSWVDRIQNFASQFNANQYFHVEIRDTNDNVLQIAYQTHPGDTLLQGWTPRSFDLSLYAGQTIRIAFVETDSLFYFNLYLDDISVQVSSVTPGLTNDVYFGTNSTPGPAQFQGSTTNTFWDLPQLAPQTTYYWQIVARKIGTTPGPVWQFTTAGVDHFAWSAISTPQFTNTPFTVTITALDAFNTIVTNFTGPVMIAPSPANTVVPGMSDTFTNGVWTGPIFLTDRATNCVLTADDGNSHTGSSNPFDLAPVNMPPKILTQPNDQTSEAGSTVTFSVSAGGTPPLLYQWFFNDTNSIPGATNATLTLTNVQPSSAGNYSVAVTNSYGWTNSSDAALTVIVLDHFAWGQIPSPQFVNAPFAVTILAQDAANGTFTNFNGTVLLTVTNGVVISPTVSGSFAQGLWTGSINVSQMTSNIVFKANDGAGHIGFSYPIDVVNVPRLSVTNQSGAMQISWPQEPDGFILESSDSLSQPDWSPVADPPVLTNGLYIQSIPFTETNQFFRLNYSGN
jgi:hypothetical protein